MSKYKKRIAIVLLLMMAFTFLLSITALGDTGVRDVGNPFEKAVAGLLDFINRTIVGIWDAVGFKSLADLVFASGLTEAEQDSLPWQPSQVPYIISFYKGLSIAVMPIFVFLVALSGFKFIFGAVNPTERAEAKDSVMRLFYGLLIVLLAPYLVEILMQASLFLTSSIALAYSNIGDVADLQALNIDIIKSDNIATGSILGTVFIKIAFGMMFVYLNLLYIIRMVGITVMVVFTPLMAMWWVVNKNTTAIAIWLGELASNAFMPVAHALVLCVILMLADVKNVSQDGSWATILIMLYALIPLSEALRNSMQSIFTRAAGFSEEATARSALGGIFGGISSVARVGKATLGNGKLPDGKGISPVLKDTFGPPRTPSGPTSGGSKMATPKRQPIISTGPTTGSTTFGSMSAGPTAAPKGPTITTVATAGTTPSTLPTRKSTLGQPVPMSKGTATVYNAPSRMATKTATMTTAAKVGAVAGKMVKVAAIPAMMVAGAVPGGSDMVRTGTAMAHQVAVTGTTAATAAGQIANAYRKNKNLGKSLQQVTGTADKKQAMTRLAKTTLSANPLGQTGYQYQAKKRFKTPIGKLPGAGTQYPCRTEIKKHKPKSISITPGNSGGTNDYSGPYDFSYGAWRDYDVTPQQRYTMEKRGLGGASNRGEAADKIASALRTSRLP